MTHHRGHPAGEPGDRQQKGRYVVAVINVEWARPELQKFLSAARVVQKDDGDFAYWTTAEPPAAVLAQAHVVEPILDRLVPGWPTMPVHGTNDSWDQHREGCTRALVALDREQEIRENLGEDAPQLDASHLHPWVWEGARSLWQSGHHGEAVRAASRKVNAEAQNKLGRRDAAETNLLKSAFSTDPAKPGQPRLRLHPNDGSDTFKSLHAGAGAFAHGCYAALRNPASHDPQDELSQDQALEQLAAFSILARWIDQGELER